MNAFREARKSASKEDKEAYKAEKKTAMIRAKYGRRKGIVRWVDKAGKIHIGSGVDRVVSRVKDDPSLKRFRRHPEETDQEYKDRGKIKEKVKEKTVVKVKAKVKEKAAAPRRIAASKRDRAGGRIRT